jgi:predicted nucleic acid-binding protein
MLILDPSVAAKWFIGGEASEAAEVILDRIAAGEIACAPALFRWEIENLLLSAQRAGRIDGADADRALDALRDLPVRFEEPGDRFFAGAEMHLAQAYDLSAYDAAYLAAAANLDAELVTADAPLDRAARDLGLRTVLIRPSP